MQWTIEKAALKRKFRDSSAQNLENMQELDERGRRERATLEKKIEGLRCASFGVHNGKTTMGQGEGGVAVSP